MNVQTSIGYFSNALIYLTLLLRFGMLKCVFG